VDLGNGIAMSLVRIPAGQFVMGDAEGAPDEQPPAIVTIDKPFWMSTTEVSNEQFAQFDRAHDSRFEHRSSWIFSEEYLGWRLNQPKQPVVRVSWGEAAEFCRWLAKKLGEKVTLPTEAQWEYACRAGTDSALSHGAIDADFSRFANLGDVNLRRLADEGWRPKSPDLVPREARFNDGALVTAPAGSYLANAWGLFDMHGNAAEWTRSSYTPHPNANAEDLDAGSGAGTKVVRGGSWRDRPKLCRSASRLGYSGYQRVYNVGFRIVVEE
jgi:formylglycine-generating enzyme required for sulfatase activity